jgi:hypothetical protein
MAACEEAIAKLGADAAHAVTFVEPVAPWTR